jgi:hypothetical protein
LHFLPDLDALYALHRTPNFYEIHPCLTVLFHIVYYTTVCKYKVCLISPEIYAEKVILTASVGTRKSIDINHYLSVAKLHPNVDDREVADFGGVRVTSASLENITFPSAIIFDKKTWTKPS